MLRERGFRMTPQRLAILQSLHEGGHLSPSQIYERVRASGMTEATVYRTLDFLAANEIVYPHQQGDSHLTYELAGTEHHHLICRLCGQEVEVEHVHLKPLFAKLEEMSGFQAIGRHITFFGMCPDCAKQKGYSSSHS